MEIGKAGLATAKEIQLRFVALDNHDGGAGWDLVLINCLQIIVVTQVLVIPSQSNARRLKLLEALGHQEMQQSEPVLLAGNAEGKGLTIPSGCRELARTENCWIAKFTVCLLQLLKSGEGQIHLDASLVRGLKV